MKLNDLKEASFAGAALSTLGDKLRGRPEGQLSIADRMAQQQFSQDLIGKLSAGLSQGIQGGIINPDPKVVSQPAAAPAPKPSAPAPQASASSQGGTQTPAQIRQAKQAAAGQVAQQQMAKSPAPVKQAAAAQPQVQATPAQTRQAKQAAATQAVQQQMAKSPAPVKQSAPASAAPTAAPATPGSKQLGPKGRATLARLGKQKQVRASGPQQSLDLNENDSFSRLDFVFESIMTLDEAGQYQYTISSYVQNFMKKFMGGANTNSIKALADEIQATYGKDKGRAALSKLASAAYSLYHTDGTGDSSDGEPAGTGAQSSSSPIGSALDALTGASSTPSSPVATQNASGGAPATAQSAPAEPEAQSSAGAPVGSPATAPDAKTVYKRAKELMAQLNKQQKGYILKALEKELGMSAPAAKPSATPEPTKNFGLQNNYGKITTNAPTGVPSPATVSNRASKVNVKKKPAMNPVSESKQFKVWGTPDESK